MALRLGCQFLYAKFQGRRFDGLDRPLVSFFPGQPPQLHSQSRTTREIDSGSGGGGTGNGGVGGDGGGGGIAPTSDIGHATSDNANDLAEDRSIKSKTHDAHPGVDAGRDTVPVDQSLFGVDNKKEMG